MAAVQADPDALRRFAGRLRAAQNDVEQRLRALTREFQGIGWRDDQGQKFEASLRQSLSQIEGQMRRLTDECVPVLERKARALDEFRR